MEVLAKRLKWLRDKERYSQKDIAKKIGMTASGYQKIEYGERDPKLDVLVELCNIFEVSADFLLGRDNSIEELNRISRLIDNKVQQIQYYEEEFNELLVEITELRRAMIDSSQEKGIVDVTTIELSERLDVKITEYGKIRRRIDDLEFERNNNILSYIKTLLQIPESKPWEDGVIGGYLPFKTSIQMNIFDEYELILSGEGIGGLGTYDVYKGELEAVKTADELLIRLNGK